MKKYSVKQFLDDFGPVLAGFQIAVSIVSFFGIGAFASWVIEHWFPFTRWVWTEIISYIDFPDISDPEKDALTAIAFFIPMAVSALLNRLNNHNSDSPDKGKLLRVRIAALVIGVIFMYLVGSRVIFDMLEMASNFEVTSFYEVFRYSNMVIVLLMIPYIIHFLYARLISKEHINDWERYYERSSKIRRISQVLMFTVLLVTAAGGGIWLAAAGMGWIRAFAPLFILLCLGTTVIFHPNRLLNTAGVVIAFVGASFGWELALAVVEIIESVPNNT